MFRKILRCVLSISLAFSLAMSPVLSTTAYAWASYDGPVAAFMATPLHEDITQFAYGQVVKDKFLPALADSGVSVTDSGAYLVDSGPAGKNLLWATTEQEYREKKYFLRMGSYWNDVATNNVIEFAWAWKYANNVAPYRGSSYGSAYEVGRHLSATVSQNIPRAMARFSFNERANFLHSMVGIDANGSYLDQKTMAEFQWQWLEVAYKYARDGKNANLTDEQKALLSFVDPYNQYTAGNSNAAPGSFTPADDTMSEDQLRLRALGSMCHTIEDSFNPAHSIRSYYEGDGGSQFGTLLAFGNYNVQGSSNHSKWDAPSVGDKEIRTDLVDASETLYNLKKYSGSFETEMKTTRTLGLYLAWNAAYTLMDMYAKGATWEEVETWLKSDVLKTNFNSDGTAIIWDAGRRAGNIGGLSEYISYVGSRMNRFVSGISQDTTQLTTYCNQLYNYHNDMSLFFQKGTEPLANSVYHTAYEVDGQEGVQGILQTSQEILSKVPEAEMEKFLKNMLPSQVERWKETIIKLNGVAQEFSLDLNGKTDATAKANTEFILSVLDRTRVTQVTGIIAAKDDKGYLLRTVGSNAMDSIMRIEYDAEFSTLEVGQTAAISFVERTPDPADAPVSYYATGAVTLSDPKRYTAKGVLKSATSQSMVLISNEGDAEYVLALADRNVIPDGLVGCEVIVVYTALPNQPLTAVNVYGTEERELLSLPEATVVALYGDQMRIRVGEVPDEDLSDTSMTLPDYYDVSYGDADVLGTPSVGSKVRVVYPDWALSENQSQLNAYISASRIVCDNHSHTLLYQSNGNRTHQAYCMSLDFSTLESCTLGADGRCTKCNAIGSRNELARGSGSSTKATAAPSPIGVLGNSADTNPATADMAKDVLARIAQTGGARFVNVTSIAPNISASIAAGAPKGTKIFVDTMENNVVLARLAFDAAEAGKLQTPIDARVDLSEAATSNVRTLFQKWYSNKMAFVALGQRGAYGTPVELSLKLDLTGMDTANLRAYSYNPATNQYVLLAKPWVDKNGYVHATTSAGGYLIITDSEFKTK